MEHLVRLFEDALTDSLEVAALVLAIAATTGALRKKLTPSWQYAIWLLLLVKLALPLLPGDLEDRASWLSLPESAGWFSGGAREITASPSVVATESGGVASPTEIGATAGVAIAELPPATPSPGSLFPAALAIVWLAGAAAVWTALISAHLRMVRALRRESAIAVPSELDDAWRRIRPAGGPNFSRVQLRVTELVSAPALIGVLSPSVLVPRSLLGRLNEAEWECVLRHELAHLRRRDIPANLLAGMLASIHWFNPLVWYGLSRMRAAQESACDASVLRSPGLKETYAASLIKLLEHGVSRRIAPGAVGFFGHKKQIKRRMIMIRDYRPAKKKTAFVGISVLALTAVLLLPSAFAADKPDNPAPPAPSAAASPSPAELPAREAGDDKTGVRPKLVLKLDGKMTSPYGERVHPVSGKKTLHDGIDIAGKKGTPVPAAASGTIVLAKADSARGNVVAIGHDAVWSTEYRHLDKLGVKEGDRVEAGDIIGWMGSTGQSTGPHLHYSVLENGEYVDPVRSTTIGLGKSGK